MAKDTSGDEKKQEAALKKLEKECQKVGKCNDDAERKLSEMLKKLKS